MTHIEEKQYEQETETKLPSFSIVYETENLATVELENIYQSLASIAAQDISPEQANEFLIVDSGDAPAEVIEQICSNYPWITVRKVPEMEYYEAKMTGASLATGEIIVFWDSDCLYVSNWLRSILTFFSQNPDINIVAGETRTPIRNNPFDLAIAMHYFFPRYSDTKQPYESNIYNFNNVAFRRDFLLQNPFPLENDLPLYRGQCGVHAYHLCQIKGYKLLKHPQALATHEPPTRSFSFWRYLLLGHDRVVKKCIISRLKASPEITNYSELGTEINFTPRQRLRGIITRIWQQRLFNQERILAILQEDPRRLLLLPLAFPIILWFELLEVSGNIITYFKPDWLLKRYKETESKLSEAESTEGLRFSSIK